MNANRWQDHFAICETKARYCRLLDEKNWDAFAELFTDDVVLDTRPSGGMMVNGREQAVSAIRGGVEAATTVHQVHTPEITFIDDVSAQVIWAMQDRVIWDDVKAQKLGKRSLTGFGHYRERYQRGEDGHWRIAQSTLTRLHIDFEPL